MRNSLLFILLFSILSGCSAQPNLCESASASGVVAALKPKEQFRTMLTRLVGLTLTSKIAASRNDAASEEQLRVALDDVVSPNSGLWEENLIASWQTLKSEDLQNVCNAINQQNPTILMNYTTLIGPEVQRLNEPLLKSAAVDVLEQIDI